MKLAGYSVQLTLREKLVYFVIIACGLFFTVLGAYGLWQGIVEHGVTINIVDVALFLLGLVLFSFGNWYLQRCSWDYAVALAEKEIADYLKNSRSS